MRVAVIGAGGPAGVNVCRALHAAGHDVTGLDTNALHLQWASPWCARTVHHEQLDIGELNALDVDVIHSQPEQPLLWLSNPVHQLWLDAATCLPDRRTILVCQDKFEAGLRWRAAGLRDDRVVLVEDAGGIGEAISWNGARPFWLRARHGAGARGAILAGSYDEAAHWLGYWQARDPSIDFVAEEFLPGRDFCWTSLWNHGQLVAAFARERLEWIYPHLSPSGRTGTPTICVTVHDDRVSRIAEQAILTIDPVPHGIMAVDLVEDSDGTPRPTEINAGRWPTTSPMYAELGVNLADLHVRIAAGLAADPIGDHVYAAGVTLARHIDCGHIFSTDPVPA